MGQNHIILCGTGPWLQGARWGSDHRLRIGRQGHLEIVCDDPSVSPEHAEVALTDRGWVIRDWGSSGGTLVNGREVGLDGQKLHAQDLIRCGVLSLRVAVLEEAKPLLKTPSGLVKIQAVADRSWEQALEGLTLPEGQNPRQARHLLTLLRAGYHLRHIASLDELMQSILDDTAAVLEAQRGCIILKDEATGELNVRTVSGGGSRALGGPGYSRTLAERCFQQGQSLLCQDVSQDVELQTSRSTVRSNMSSIICALLRSPRQQLGVLHLDRGPFQEPFNEEDFFLADAIAASVSAGIESAELVARQRELFFQTVTTLARAVELRDRYTGSHTQRVTEYAVLLAQELNLPSAERQHIRTGTPLHDIGKIGISDSVLQKPGQLTAEEFEVMKSHTVTGAAMLATIPDLAPMLPIIRHHHERWDGRGYPDQLAGASISPLAQVVAVADAFDAMTSDRPYRPAFPLDRAFAEIRIHAGSHFAPVCAEAFLRLRPRIEAHFRTEFKQ